MITFLIVGAIVNWIVVSAAIRYYDRKSRKGVFRVTATTLE